MSKNVEKNVDKRRKPKSEKKSPYLKGKFPKTVYNTETKKLYVRKSETISEKITDPETGEVSIITKQKQHWRICDPPTKEVAAKILADLERDLNFKRTGFVAPLSNFGEICDKFSEHELVEAIYENGLKIAGRRSLYAPRLMVKMLKEKFGHREIGEITLGEIERFKVERIKTPVVTKNKTRPRTKARN